MPRLLLTRGLNEKIRIGDDITISIYETVGWGPLRRFRLSIEAPREVAVNREEIYQAKKKAKADGQKEGAA